MKIMDFYEIKDIHVNPWFSRKSLIFRKILKFSRISPVPLPKLYWGWVKKSFIRQKYFSPPPHVPQKGVIPRDLGEISPNNQVLGRSEAYLKRYGPILVPIFRYSTILYYRHICQIHTKMMAKSSQNYAKITPERCQHFTKMMPK